MLKELLVRKTTNGCRKSKNRNSQSYARRISKTKSMDTRIPKMVLLKGNKTKAKRHKIAPTILELLKEIPIGKARKFRETEELKATSVYNFIHRRHKKGELLEYNVLERKIGDEIFIFIVHNPPPITKNKIQQTYAS